MDDVNPILLQSDVAGELISACLVASGCSQANACYFAAAILDTELAGLDGHGFYWLQFYCEHLRSGKVNGRAEPEIEALSPVSFRVNANRGFAHPAIETGFAELIPAATTYGIAAMAIHNSYNAATLGFHTEHLAKRGLVALGFTNSVPAIAPVGGTIPLIGTNPMSFAVPGDEGKAAFVIDQSSSAVAWTAVKRAADEGRQIPLGWALDTAGQPTTDPAMGLVGSMAPAGGYKGFSQGLIVETLCAAVAGALRGPQMGSFTENDGRPIGCGQFFIALEPEMFSGGLFAGQIRALCASITAQAGARLPNARRIENRRVNQERGLAIAPDLLARLRELAT